MNAQATIVIAPNSSIQSSISSASQNASRLTTFVDFANGAYIILLAGTLLSTLLIVRWSKKLGAAKDELDRLQAQSVALDLKDKDDAFTRFKIDSEKQLFVLETAASEAKSAQQKVEIELANSQKETAEVQALVAWRTLTPQVTSDMRATLAEHPSTVTISYSANETESLFFAIQISRLFKGWNIIDGGGVTYPGIIIPALTIVGGSAKELAIVQDAFRESQVNFSPTPIRVPTLQFFGSSGSGVNIIVGPKERPEMFRAE